ncbi:hypothetical protein PVAP13_5NG066662 [Panicum virgatum]|uniref:Uncharacterized protein n=1 Tax=Panicum virgatum TaxID=38727 RepID=A0A8T0RMP1_PANVG|nr:hypothetical protein PVAP13_5NG066662 [Panicum virgatum]
MYRRLLGSWILSRPACGCHHLPPARPPARHASRSAPPYAPVTRSLPLSQSFAAAARSAGSQSQSPARVFLPSVRGGFEWRVWEGRRAGHWVRSVQAWSHAGARRRSALLGASQPGCSTARPGSLTGWPPAATGRSTPAPLLCICSARRAWPAGRGRRLPLAPRRAWPRGAGCLPLAVPPRLAGWEHAAYRSALGRGALAAVRHRCLAVASARWPWPLAGWMDRVRHRRPPPAAPIAAVAVRLRHPSPLVLAATGSLPATRPAGHATSARGSPGRPRCSCPPPGLGAAAALGSAAGSWGALGLTAVLGPSAVVWGGRGTWAGCQHPRLAPPLQI